jgi:ABC-type ATPase with predicted acetyltransferase domain
MERAVSGAIMDMQFQDRVMQHIQNVNAALTVLGRAGAVLAAKWRSNFDGLPPQNGDAAVLLEMANQFTLSDMRDRFITALQIEGYSGRAHSESGESGESGDVDLF